MLYCLRKEVAGLVFVTNSVKETVDIGIRIGKALSQGTVLAFYGDLGAGKTQLISGIAEGLGFCGETFSPTFAIVNEYSGGRIPMFHFDMYRINGWDDLETTGFFDALDSGAVLAIEWAENIEAALPENTVRITLEGAGDMPRKIDIKGLEI